MNEEEWVMTPECVARVVGSANRVRSSFTMFMERLSFFK